jgi:hypothetical protein
MDIGTIKTESKLANNLVKSLSRGYKLTTDKDQVKFLTLSVYLLALGQEEESEKICRFISSCCKYDENENTWNSVGHQTLLLARLERLRGNTAESKALVGVVLKEDILSSRLTKNDYLHELLSEFDEDLELLLNETPKWRCEGAVFMYINLNYCREFVEVTHYEPISEVIKKTETKMDCLLKLLNENLT